MSKKALLFCGVAMLVVVFGCASKYDINSNVAFNKLSKLVPYRTTTPIVASSSGELVSTTSINNITLTFFGDMMLDRNVKKIMDQNSPDYIFSKLFQATSNTLFMADIIHANLEGPFANQRRATSKSIAFRFDPVLIPTLKKFGFNTFNLANNHSLDMSAAGFAESQTNLLTAGIDFYGNQYKVNSSSLLVKEINGLKLAFIGLNDTNAPIDEKMTGKLLASIRDTVDVVIINIHWGAEYKTISNIHQRNLAHWLIDNGADVIVGHHPHVVEEMEIYKNRLIFYSLGNFVFDQYFSIDTQQGLAVKIEINHNKKLSARIFPLQGVKSQLDLMTGEAEIKFFANWIKNSRLDKHDFVNSSTLEINL